MIIKQNNDTEAGLAKAMFLFDRIAQESHVAREGFITTHREKVCSAAFMIHRSFQAGGKLLIFGNGGSAADAQHMAAELTGRLLKERAPLPAIALTTDSSALTAIGNDYGYDQVFLRQVQALASPKDVIFAISTSGNSKNVLSAVKAAKTLGCRVIALTGGTGGALDKLADIGLCVSKGANSCRIQETHIFAIHAIIDVLDSCCDSLEYRSLL